MAGITKHLGIAIADADAGRITHRQLLEIFQDAIDNGDILEPGNEEYVVTAVFPLVDARVLKPSIHVEAFERRMNSIAQNWLRARTEPGQRGQPNVDRGAGEPGTIVSQANTVGRILQDYIAIHDDFFAGGFVRSLRRMVPIPGIFQAVDFARHSRDLDGLTQELQAVRDGIGGDDPPVQLADPLSRYCDALLNALLRLQRVTHKLAGRKDDPSSYTEREYKADLRRYGEGVLEYRLMGEQLNQAFRAPSS